MPAFNSVGRFAPQFMAGDGRGVFLVDKVVLSSAPAVNDTLEFTIPAGLEVAALEIQCDDMDTNASPTLAFSVGYAPARAGSAISAAPTYFAPAGQTTMRTGGRLACSFKPFKFDEDVILRITIGTAAATFAAGEVFAVIHGNSRGVR